MPRPTLNLDRIHRIPAPTPFPVGPVNTYLIEGKSLVLIDAGLKTEASFAALEAGIVELGLRLKDIRSVVLTHHHVDHAGGARTLQRVSGAQVFAHPGDRTRLAKGDRHPCVREALANAGLTPETLEKLERVGDEVHAYHEPLDDVAPLAEDAVVETGAGPLRVLYTPGHTQGSLSLRGDDGTLFSGDTVLERITPNAVLDGEARGRWRALPTYVRTLAKLSEMRFSRVLPGHGEPFDDLPKVAGRAFSLYRERGRLILDLLRDAPRTVAELGERLFGPADPASIFLVISEVYGNLDLLESHGLVEIVGEHPFRYRASGSLDGNYPLSE